MTNIYCTFPMENNPCTDKLQAAAIVHYFSLRKTICNSLSHQRFFLWQLHGQGEREHSIAFHA